RLEAAQRTVHSPILGELDRGARQVAVLTELVLEALEERERVGRAAREPGEHAPVVEPAHLPRVALHDLVAERDLTVAAERDAAFAPNAENRGAFEGAHVMCLCRWI